MGNAQAPCHDGATITKNNFNILGSVAGGFSPKVETRPRVGSDFPDWHRG
jgi:hypothetical protein